MRPRAAALLLLLATSCAPELAPSREPSPAVRTERDRYVLVPNPYGHEATIVATFTAPRDTTVHLVHCNGAIPWGLQRETNGVWTDAWVATMNGCFSTPKVVPAGTSHVETLTVISRTDIPPGPGPVQHEVAPGTYRVVWYQVLTSFDPENWRYAPELSLARRVSGPITIDRAP